MPTIADRIAQSVVAAYRAAGGPWFHQNSYGYRPGRSAHDALAVCGSGAGSTTGRSILTSRSSSTLFPGTSRFVRCGR